MFVCSPLGAIRLAFLDVRTDPVNGVGRGIPLYGSQEVVDRFLPGMMGGTCDKVDHSLAVTVYRHNRGVGVKGTRDGATEVAGEYESQCF